MMSVPGEIFIYDGGHIYRSVLPFASLSWLVCQIWFNLPGLGAWDNRRIWAYLGYSCLFTLMSLVNEMIESECVMGFFRATKRNLIDSNFWILPCFRTVSYEEAQIKYVWKNDEDTLRKSPSLTTLNAYLIKNQTTACDQNSWRGKSLGSPCESLHLLILCISQRNYNWENFELLSNRSVFW